MLGGFIWSALDRTPVGGSFQKGRIKVFSFDDLLTRIRALPRETAWRHNQAGDLPSQDRQNICRKTLRQLVAANRGRRGFTYTHFDVIENRHNRAAIADANRNGFTINLSGNSPAHADALADTDCGPVTTILPSDQLTNIKTPAGRPIVICPATTHPGVTCATCQLCARKRDVVIGFPALGAGRRKISGNDDILSLAKNKSLELTRQNNQRGKT